MILDLILRWIHLFSAITLVGGIFFMRFALLPGIKDFEADRQAEIRAGVRPFWARCVMMTSGLLLVTGLVNAVTNIVRYDFSGPYHGLVAVKLLIALAIFWFAAILSGKSKAADQFRQKELFWMNVIVTLTVAIVCVAGFMKLQARTPKPTDESSSVPFEIPSHTQIEGIMYVKLN